MLRCPECRIGVLARTPSGHSCSTCGEAYLHDDGGRPDLRRPRRVEWTANTNRDEPGGAAPPLLGRPPTRAFRETAWRAPHELLSVLSDILPVGGRLLDAGCGNAALRRPAREELNLAYVGLDIEGNGADVLADLHGVPFADGCFDGVVSYAVVSCCRYPDVVVSEIQRVLRAGGSLVATFSAYEPFVGDRNRFTHVGARDLLERNGLRVERVWACRDVLSALASYIGPYPAVTKVLLRTALGFSTFGPLAPRRWLRETESQRRERELWTAGSLGIVARKPDGTA